MMIAANAPRALVSQRLLAIDRAQGSWKHLAFDALPTLLSPGDALVLNDAATLPASLFGRSPAGAPLELRLAAREADSLWRVAVLGAGDWSTPTERRGPPPALSPGDRLDLDGGLSARVVAADPRSPHLALVDFERSPAALLAALHAVGHPVQYSYLSRGLRIDETRTPYARRARAAEMPSAGRALRWSILLELRRRGVQVLTLTHAAGLSSIDGGALDLTLPLPEESEIPERTVQGVLETRRSGGRVVAVGTTVVRALEGRVADAGALVAGVAKTSLILSPSHQPAVVDGVLTQMHEPGESHFELLSAFAPRRLLIAAMEEAAGRGYLAHEYGDSALIL